MLSPILEDFALVNLCVLCAVFGVEGVSSSFVVL